MKDLNKIILIGRLGADPVQRETKNGTAVVHFPLATSRRLRNSADGTEGSESGVAVEETVWHRVVVWGRQGQNCAQYLRKGQPVYVEGSIRSRKYSGKDGISRMAFEVHADNIGFLGNGPARNGLSEEEAELSEAQ